MAEVAKINTKDTRDVGVEIDGHVWRITFPGVGTEFRLSQAQREATLYEARIKLLNDKIDSGTITEEELDKYEDYITKAKASEEFFYESVISVIKDNTNDNSEVREWIDSTRLYKVIKAVEDIRYGIESSDGKQSEDKKPTK